MSRIIKTTKLASLAALMVAALAGTSAHAQVIDLRLSPFGGVGNRTGSPAARFQPGFNRFPTGIGSNRGTHPARHQNVPSFPSPGVSVAPGFPGGGFPGGGVPQTPGIAPTFPVPGPGGGHCAPGVSPVIGAVDALIGQVGAFLQAFGPTVRCVPQGERIYADALALYESALAFRQAALAGAPPCDLRPLYAAMDASCNRLVSRVNCIARGRSGPNIEQVRLIGLMCQQIRTMI